MKIGYGPAAVTLFNPLRCLADQDKAFSKIKATDCRNADDWEGR